MAKKTKQEAVEFDIVNGNFDEHDGYDIEVSLQNKLRSHEQTQQQHSTQIGSKVSGIRVNNVAVSKDGNGVVDITVPVVDMSLSEESPNAVQNAAVASALNGVKAAPFAGVRTDPVEGDSSQLNLVFTNEQGTDFASVRIPAASEVGTVTFPRVTTELLTPARVKLGDSISMRWTYDHIIQEEGVQSTSGTAAQTVTIRALIGATEVYSVTKPSVAAGTTEVLTLGPDVITQAGTVNIYVIAQTVYGEEAQRAQGFKSVSVITMDLAISFDPASALALSNGFVDGQTITIPYTYTVPAGTTIYIYKDGVQFDTATVSGTARGNVYLTAADLTAGRHNIQLVAVSSGLLSNVVSIDLLKAGSSNSYLGFRMSVPIAQLADMPLPYAYGSEAIPLTAEQFGSLALDYAVWKSDTLEAEVVVAVDGVTTQTLSADRTMQTLNQRFDASGTHALTISVGGVTRTFAVVVSASAGVTETEPVGYRNKLTANGRTNNESLATRSDWGGITTFTGVDYRTNGWNTDQQGVTAMLLTNGARSVHEIYPFVLDETDNDYSIQNQGMTFLMDIKVSQVMERGATIVSCLWDNNNDGYPMGIKITTEEAGLYFGGVESIKTAEKVTDANGNYLDAYGNIVSGSSEAADLYVTRPHGVAMNIARDRWIHLAFVVQPVHNGYGLAMLFINGKLSRANRYSGSLRQNTPQAIMVDSDKADVRIRSMYYYRTALTSDEIVAIQILSRPTAAEIQAEHDANDVGDSNGTADSDGNIVISRDALRGKGRGTLTIIRSTDSGNGLTDIFSCVDKKQDFLADYVRWDPPLDANGNPIGQGFEAYNIIIRIQGTSSVKYPYKNIRIYIVKAYGTLERTLFVGGVDVTDTAKGYAMRGAGNSIEQSVLCAKTDFVDSSLAGNTGGAHLFDDTMRALGLLTPPQEYDARVRQSVDGLPCDIFCGTSMVGALTYCGQFVLNNEKSKSGAIFGMEGVKDGEGNAVNWPCAFALESLDNNSPMTLFHPAGSAGSTALRNQLAEEFDEGFEFNFPEDAKWANVNEGQWDASKNKWSVKPVDGSFTDSNNNTWVGARGAVERLMGWIYDCVPAAMRANPDYGTAAGWSAESKAKWVSSKFKNEVHQYFVLTHLLTYYLIIDYLAGKDQLVKNIIWRTWDGLKWWAGFYDGDTWEAIRNDAFIVYLYNITRDSYDSERAKYAFEGHSSWLWCLVLANLEDELKQCAVTLRNKLTNQKMLDEFIGNMIGNWSARQYNKSGKLKYIDTIDTMNYVYTLTGSREEHIRQFISDRARLLDARYGAGDYNGDVVTFTVVREAGDTPSSLTLTSGDLYYFGYKLNGIWLQGPLRAALGDQLTLNFTQRLATNDPLMLGGASCIKELDLTAMGSQLNGTVNLSLCGMLSRLVMRATNGVSNAPLTLGNTSKLEYIDITGQTAVHTGTAGVFDVSKHTRLTTLLAGGTSLTSIVLAEGAPVMTLVIPSTLSVLRLRYLPVLTIDGLTLESPQNITSLNFAQCPCLDWRVLLQECPNIDHVRIEGISGRFRSSELRGFMSGFHGLTATGSEQTYPALLGTAELEDYPSDIEEMQAFFERCGLTLKLPEYTMIEFDDSVSDDANVSNLDNRTGYKYGNDYVPSGHIAVLLSRRHRVLAKLTRLPTSRTITHAGVETQQNNGDGEMTIYPLHDDNSNYYADGRTVGESTAALLDGSEGDWMMLEPHRWTKGVNDYLNGKHYSCYSTLEQRPSSAAATVVTLSDIESAGKVRTGYKISAGKETLEMSYASDSSRSVCCVEVAGFSRVRFPSVLGTNMMGAVFTDAERNVVGSVVVPTLNPRFEDGMYVIADIPAGALELYFTILNTAEFDKVVLSNSTRIEDMEPDWVETDEYLCGVVGSTAVGEKLRACVTGGTNNAGMNWTDFHYYSYRRGMQQIDGMMHNDIGNLFFAKYGRRNSQMQCGAGQHSYTRTVGVTAKLGMRDTVNTNGSTVGGTENSGLAFYSEGAVGQEVFTRINSTNCLGYEDIYGHKTSMMDCVDMPNSAGKQYKWRFRMPDGSERWVKGSPTNNLWITAVAHGKYMDLVPVGSIQGSSSTYYSDMYYVQGTAGRVVYRGNSYAYACGGVSYAYAFYAPSYSYAVIGSRLAFRGQIVRAASVEAFKSIIEVA